LFNEDRKSVFHGTGDSKKPTKAPVITPIADFTVQDGKIVKRNFHIEVKQEPVPDDRQIHYKYVTYE
jgi:hypothetical protein